MEVEGPMQPGAQSPGSGQRVMMSLSAGMSARGFPKFRFDQRHLHSRNAKLTMLNIFLFAGLVTATLIWLPFSTVAVQAGLCLDLIIAVAPLISLWVVLGGLRYQLGRVPLKYGDLLGDVACRIQTLMMALLAIGLLSLSLLLYSYLATATSRVLMDAYLAAFDSMFGFSWMGYTAWFNSHSLLASITSMAYASLKIQLLVVPAVLALTRRTDRLQQFIAYFGLSGVLTCIVMTFMPTAGAFDFFHPSTEILSSFSAGASTRHLDQLHALRELKPFVIQRPEGLVTFPSFHSALAIIFAYSVRGIRCVALPAVALNVLMILSTPPEGGHYLADVIAGIAIAMISFWLVSRIAGSSTALQNSLLTQSRRLRA